MGSSLQGKGKLSERTRCSAIPSHGGCGYCKLSNAEIRRSLFGGLAKESTKALVITEGLLVYLREQEVSALAEDLKGFPAFKRWVLDIVSPGLLRHPPAAVAACMLAGRRARRTPITGIRAC